MTLEHQETRRWQSHHQGLMTRNTLNNTSVQGDRCIHKTVARIFRQVLLVYNGWYYCC